MICGSFEAPLVTKRALEAFCFAGCAVSFLEVNEHLQSAPAPLGMPKSTKVELLLVGDVANPSPKKTKNLPSGYVNIAIENGHRNSEFSHEEW